MLPRRRWRVTCTRSPRRFAASFHSSLVDVAVVDLGASGGYASRASTLARSYPTVAFLGLSQYLLGDAPAIASTAAMFADVLAEGVDDTAIGALLTAYAFRRRFAAALAEPPVALGLTAPLHRALWRTLLHLPGRAVRTSELARSLGISREHLSRSFRQAAGTPSLKRVSDLPRLLAAAQLAVNPGYALGDVARLLGFPSASHLSRTARRLTGCRGTDLRRVTMAELIRRFEHVATSAGHERATLR